jgi:hypothetical protein
MFSQVFDGTNAVPKPALKRADFVREDIGESRLLAPRIGYSFGLRPAREPFLEIFRDAALLISFLDMLGFPLLLRCVTRFISLWHFPSWLKFGLLRKRI